MQLVRTKIIQVGSEAVIDLTWLGHKDDPISVTIEPQVVDSVTLKGVAGDDAINIGEGITLNLNLAEKITTVLPLLASTGGTVNVNLIVGAARL